MNTPSLGLKSADQALVALLKQKRLELGLTISDLAKELNIAPATLLRLEVGMINFTPALMGRMLDVFGCSFQDLWSVAREAETRFKPVAENSSDTIDPQVDAA